MKVEVNSLGNEIDLNMFSRNHRKAIASFLIFPLFFLNFIPFSFSEEIRFLPGTIQSQSPVISIPKTVTAIPTVRSTVAAPTSNLGFSSSPLTPVQASATKVIPSTSNGSRVASQSRVSLQTNPIPEAKIIGQEAIKEGGQIKEFQLTVQTSPSVSAVKIYYKNNITDPWRLAETVPVSGGTTSTIKTAIWKDTGLHNLTPEIQARFYKVEPAKEEIQDGLTLIQVKTPDSSGKELNRNLKIDLTKESGEVFENGQVAGTYTRAALKDKLADADGYIVIQLNNSTITPWVLFSKDQKMTYTDLADQATGLTSKQVADHFMSLAARILYAPESTITHNTFNEFMRTYYKIFLNHTNRAVTHLFVTRLKEPFVATYKTQHMLFLLVNYMPVGDVITEPDRMSLVNLSAEILQDLPSDNFKAVALTTLVRFFTETSDSKLNDLVFQLLMDGFSFFLEVTDSNLQRLINKFIDKFRQAYKDFESMAKEKVELLFKNLLPYFSYIPLEEFYWVKKAVFQLGIALTENKYLGVAQKKQLLHPIFSFFKQEQPLLTQDHFENILSQIFVDILNLEREAPEDADWRSLYIDEWATLFDTAGEVVEPLKSKLPSSTGLNSARVRVYSLGLFARTAADIQKVSEVLHLSAGQKAIFKDYRILLIDISNRSFASQEIEIMADALSKYPRELIKHFGVIVRVQSLDAGSGAASKIADDLGWVSLIRINSIGTLNHELWHIFTGVSFHDEYLYPKIWRNGIKLYNLGTFEDRPTAYANTDFGENLAEFGKMMMRDTIEQWNRWTTKAKGGRFIGLRSLLALMEITTHNSEGKGVPFFGSGDTVYKPVATDSDHNITMVELPEKSLRYHFTYTSDSLHILKMTIENTATHEKQDFENALGVAHQKTLTPINF